MRFEMPFRAHFGDVENGYSETNAQALHDGLSVLFILLAVHREEALCVPMHIFSRQPWVSFRAGSEIEAEWWPKVSTQIQGISGCRVYSARCVVRSARCMVRTRRKVWTMV